MKDIDNKKDLLNSAPDAEASMPAEKISGIFGKLAAIYHGVPEEELVDSDMPRGEASEDILETADVVEELSGDISDSSEETAVQPLVSKDDESLEPSVASSNETLSNPPDKNTVTPVNIDEDNSDKMSRRQSRKAREEQLLYLDEEEARLQIRRELGRHRRRPLATPYTRRETVGRKRIIAVSATLAAVILLTVIIFAAGRLLPKKGSTVEVTYQSTLEKLDYQTANRLYIEHADDEKYLDEATRLLNEKKAAIVNDYMSGQSSYEAAYDELFALGLFMPLWPEEKRSEVNALALNSAMSSIDATEILADSFSAIDNYRMQERNFRIGQQLLNLDMNAMAIPYLREVADQGGTLAQTAADQLRRSESSYLVTVVNNAQSYKATGDVLRARLVLESASLILKDNAEIRNLLEGLPPVDQGKLLLDISAMAMTYFDAQRYHESLLIVDVGRDYLGELIEKIESGASLLNFSDQINDNLVDIVPVNQNDQSLRDSLADSLRRDIESLDQLEIQLRESIITELLAKAAQYSDQGKYREARDTMDVALEFEPENQTLMDLRTEYHNKTRLRLSNFITNTTASGFRISKVAEVSDQSGVIHKDIVRLGSSNYAPAMKLTMLPHRHNRFQGVFYLMDAGNAVNVQIVVQQGGTEIYRSAPLNASNPEASFDFSYDFTKDITIDLLGSGTGSATRFNRMEDISMLLDAYFYNDGSWDETNATKLHAQYLAEQEDAAKALNAKLAKSFKIDIYEELLNDSVWNSIFGHDALLKSAKDIRGNEYTKVLSIKGRTIVQIKAKTDYLQGKMYLAEGSSAGSGLILMIEDQAGKRWFSEVLTEEKNVVDLDLPVNGDFNLILLTPDGKRVEHNSIEVLIKAQLYDYEKPAEAGAPSIDGLEPTGTSTEATVAEESGRNPEGGRGN